MKQTCTLLLACLALMTTNAQAEQEKVRLQYVQTLLNAGNEVYRYLHDCQKAEKKAERKKEKKVASDSTKVRLSDPFALSAEDLLQRIAKRGTVSPTEGFPGIPSDLFTITLKDDEQDSK